MLAMWDMVEMIDTGSIIRPATGEFEKNPNLQQFQSSLADTFSLSH